MAYLVSRQGSTGGWSDVWSSKRRVRRFVRQWMRDPRGDSITVRVVHR